MRCFHIFLLVPLVLGCSDKSPPNAQNSPERQTSRDLTEPKANDALHVSKASDGRLHADRHIESLADFDIATHDGDPILDVVPNGESYSRELVFQNLSLDESKLINFRHLGINFVEYLTWKVSPSYDIECMTAINDSANDGLELNDPKRKVYGVRLKPSSD